MTAWILRFIHNSCAKKTKRLGGPLTADETKKVELFWGKRVQVRATADGRYKDDLLQLNLQPNCDGVLECRVRVQGHYPIYLPDGQRYTEKLVAQAHLATLHGGVGSTMAKVREYYWVLRLRRLTKKIVKSCRGCRRFRVQAYTSPPLGNLPRDRTEGQTPFQVIGVDFAGPLRYQKKPKTQGKTYILLYACSLTGAVPNLETTDFIRSWMCFIARRGRPRRIYSDNAKTFVSGSKWIEQVMKEQKISGFLTQQGIEWKFNLSRAPWWGGQFERLIGLVKGSLHKTIGNGLLSWMELQEVLLDVEVALNNRPLDYVEDDIQLPILTPSFLLHIQPNVLPELEPKHIQDYDLRKRAKYLSKCKDAVWSRWTKEYLRGLCERHRLKCKGDSTHPAKGDVVIIKSDDKKRAQWKLGVVIDLITGRDGVVRGAKLRTTKSVIERPVQHLYALELTCDMAVETAPAALNPTVPAFRPRRNAAVAAGARIQELAQMDDEN